jgi:tRNA nucleotidyltransferase/poly(A) polymerase
LRAIRFASRFNLTIEQNSFSALKKSAFLVKKITPDRVREELTRTFCEGDVNYALELLHNSGILSILWEIFSQEKDTLYTAVRDDMRGNQEKNPVSVWKAFFQPWTRLKNGADLVERELIKLNFPKKWKKGIMKADK